MTATAKNGQSPSFTKPISSSMRRFSALPHAPLFLKPLRLAKSHLNRKHFSPLLSKNQSRKVAPDMTDSTRPSSMVERVAKALYETAVNQAREEVSKFVIPIDKIRTVFNAALAASDREAAIIIFCLIDDIITDFFRLKLKGDIDIESSFFANNGILATA